ncbi:unnamed protein product [Rotaria sp. Silwood1]|nr:unnamed protein product [Rotaria sp. Silwood1]CAF1644117.1 unnamed protein product [Rotaria sp. Silwood1]CAF3765482.1 unnamed protein product [Rotaria sp. Silwood1]CAF3911412.1 unnamed protein product [Rotaria sp. Silwood1]CAF4796988.1 unnamed protein product [Rotaria sp. Silwood1]
MVYTFGTLPNEILLIILSNLSWLKILHSLWSLNHRINSLICLIVSRKNNKEKRAVITKASNLPYNEYYSRSQSLHNDLSLVLFWSSIQSVCFDETNSTACDINFEWIFVQNKNKKVLRFLNLKSLTITQCWLSPLLIQNLSLLIQDQLENLSLMFNDDMVNSFRYGRPIAKTKYNRSNL